MAGEELTGLALLPEGQGLLALTGDCRALFLRPTVRVSRKFQMWHACALVSTHRNAVTLCAARTPAPWPHALPW